MRKRDPPGRKRHSPLSSPLVHETPPNPDPPRIPIVAVINPLRDALLPGLPAEEVHITIILHVFAGSVAVADNGAQTHELRVPLHADVEGAHPVLQAQDLRAAPRRQVQDLLDAQPGPSALRRRDVVVVVRGSRAAASIIIISIMVVVVVISGIIGTVLAVAVIVIVYLVRFSVL